MYVIEHYIKKSVLKLNTSSYPYQDILKIQSSYDGKEYICHSKAIQGRLPCQAIVNNLNVDDVPTELGNLKKLEQLILIAQRIIFEKLIVMPKGQQQKKLKVLYVTLHGKTSTNDLPLNVRKLTGS